MRWWQPNAGDPELLDWWRPLLAAARRARHEGVQWPIHPDEFDLVGRVVRDGGEGADVWIYRHETAVGILSVDADGHAYRFERDDDLPGGGRFDPVTLGQAVWAAGLAVVHAERERRPA